MKTLKTIAGMLMVAVATFCLASLVGHRSTAQPASTHQPKEVVYAFPAYPTLQALLNDGPTPVQFGVALIRGGTTNLDRHGSIMLWNSLATTSTNANTVFAVPGITNSDGDTVGRWFALNGTTPPIP